VEKALREAHESSCWRETKLWRLKSAAMRDIVEANFAELRLHRSQRARQMDSSVALERLEFLREREEEAEPEMAAETGRVPPMRV